MAPKVAAAAARTKVLAQKVTGTITEWKGTFGWIQPSQPISHADASKNKGRIYLSQADVQAEISGIGALVSFFVYTDGKGLGAMECRPAAGGVKKSILKMPAGTAAAQGEGGKKKKKGGEKKPREPTAPVDKSQREAVTTSPVMGTVKMVRGSMAFIKPQEPIEHPFADKHKGDVYLHMDDMEGDEKPLPKATVLFFVYADPLGLGAEHCSIVEQGEEKPKEPKPTAQAVQKAAKAKAPKAREPKPQGPDLPRERLSATPVTGEVLEWKGKFGWIKATEPVAHEKAEKHQGKIYINQKDLVGADALEKGKTVQFFLYADASGLGAEECIPS